MSKRNYLLTSDSPSLLRSRRGMKPPTTRGPNPFTVCLAAAALVTTACSSAITTESIQSSTTVVVATTTPSSSVVAATAEAGFTSDDQLEWVLDAVSNPSELTVADVESRFSGSFLAVVSPEQIIETSLPLAGTWTVVEDDEGEVERLVVIEGDGGFRLSVMMAIDPADGGRMTELLLRPANPSPSDEPVTTESVDAAVAGVGAQSGYGLFDVTSGSCDPIHATNAEIARGIGSEFKLWILLAVAEQVEAGDLAWDGVVAVTDELRSTPHGEIADLPSGSEVTIAELASKMISISDNTATDMLLDHVGRENVETAMVAAGVADPARNIPMLSTRELFLLKLDPEHAGYVELDVDERRTYLDDVLAGQSLSDFDENDLPTPPWNIEELEWYASPLDLCETYLRLAEVAEAPTMAPVVEAMSINPGVTIDTDRWSTVWFKGGSEPGVFALSWYLADAEGNRYVAAGAINDPAVPFSEAVGIQALGQMIPLLEAETA